MEPMLPWSSQEASFRFSNEVESIIAISPLPEPTKSFPEKYFYFGPVRNHKIFPKNKTEAKILKFKPFISRTVSTPRLNLFFFGP